MYHFGYLLNEQEELMALASHLQSCSLDALFTEGTIPIGDSTHLKPPANNGVVKVENIPYTVTRLEIQQLFGRQAKLVDHSPIHIIMERSTGKTMECYVEFTSKQEAQFAVQRLNPGGDDGTGPRMGSRHLTITMSSVDELMKALFPTAKCIRWSQGKPIVLPQGRGINGFDGFLTAEELTSVTRHAESPGRTVFNNKVPQRNYESMISTVVKFPWSATNLYTIEQRGMIYDALRLMILALVTRLKNEKVVGLSQSLVLELAHAGYRCPAFNPRMKFVLAYIGNDTRTLARLSEEWLTFFPFDTLSWLSVPNCNPHALEFYGSMIAKGSVSTALIPYGLDNRYPRGLNLKDPYGEIWYQWNTEEGSPYCKIKFSECVAAEMRILRHLITTGFNNGGSSSVRNRPPGQENRPVHTPANPIRSNQTLRGRSPQTPTREQRRRDENNGSMGSLRGRNNGGHVAGPPPGNANWRRPGPGHGHGSRSGSGSGPNGSWRNGDAAADRSHSGRGRHEW